MFFPLVNIYLILNTLFCPLAVSRIWHNVEHEALEIHPKPKERGWRTIWHGKCNGIYSIIVFIASSLIFVFIIYDNHCVFSAKSLRNIPLELLLLTYLCLTAELWYRHTRTITIGAATAHISRGESWLSSATVKQGEVRLQYIQFAYMVQSVKESTAV